MAIKRTKLPDGKEMIEGCHNCDKANDFLWWHEGKWWIEMDLTGVRGPEAKFCPFCGARLLNPDNLIARNLGTVISEMVLHIPFSCAEMHRDLFELKKKIQFVAPEIQVAYWYSCSEILEKYIPQKESEQGWQKTVIDIFTKREEAPK